MTPSLMDITARLSPTERAAYDAMCHELLTFGVVDPKGVAAALMAEQYHTLAEVAAVRPGTLQLGLRTGIQRQFEDIHSMLWGDRRRHLRQIRPLPALYSECAEPTDAHETSGNATDRTSALEDVHDPYRKRRMHVMLFTKLSQTNPQVPTSVLKDRLQRISFRTGTQEYKIWEYKGKQRIPLCVEVPKGVPNPNREVPVNRQKRRKDGISMSMRGGHNRKSHVPGYARLSVVNVFKAMSMDEKKTFLEDAKAYGLDTNEYAICWGGMAELILWQRTIEEYTAQVKQAMKEQPAEACTDQTAQAAEEETEANPAPVEETSVQQALMEDIPAEQDPMDTSSEVEE